MSRPESDHDDDALDDEDEDVEWPTAEETLEMNSEADEL